MDRAIIKMLNGDPTARKSFTIEPKCGMTTIADSAALSESCLAIEYSAETAELAHPGR